MKANSMERWFYIDVHYAFFGIGTRDGRVFFAPPIAKWMAGKTTEEIKPWLKQRKAVVRELNPVI